MPFTLSKNLLLTGIVTIFSTKNALYIAVFCTFNVNFFRVYTPGPPQKRPGAWTQTPISAWLASVPLFPFYETNTGGGLNLH